MFKLAINDGGSIRTKPFPAYVTAGEAKKEAACRVIDSGLLSRYLVAWREQFMGGVEASAPDMNRRHRKLELEAL